MYVHISREILHCDPPCCCSVNRLKCSSAAVYKPYDRGEVRSNLGLDESFVEGSVWTGNHQGGEQTEGEVLEGVGDAAQMPEQTSYQTVTRTKGKRNH